MTPVQNQSRGNRNVQHESDLPATVGKGTPGRTANASMTIMR